MVAQQNNMQAIHVTAVESITPVGLTIEQTAAAVRAGVSGFKEHPHYAPIASEFDDEDNLIKAASVPNLEDFSLERLFNLVSEPLVRLIEKSGLERSAMAEGGLYFALPAKDSTIQKIDLRRLFIDRLARRLALPAPSEFGGVQTGATGVYELVERSMEKMRAEEIEFCIIVAVDSYLLDGRLESYDEDWRLQTKRNPAGFIPGEAGAVVLLETEGFAQKRSATGLVRIDGVGTGQEVNTSLGEKSSSGGGLTDAILPLFQFVNNEEPWRWVMSDFNGERYKAYEWGVVSTRLNKMIAGDHHLSLIADTIGDIGAATAAVQIGCVCEAVERGYAPGTSVLLIAGNDEGRRAAMALSQII